MRGKSGRLVEVSSLICFFDSSKEKRALGYICELEPESIFFVVQGTIHVLSKSEWVEKGLMREIECENS